LNPKLGKHLQRQGLLPSTKNKYIEILEAAPVDDLISWINGRVHARTPLGTVLPMRAAVKHYLVSVHGYDPDEVNELLPKARGRAAKVREALTQHQLALYHIAVDEVDHQPAHTILALLPATGLRIGEMCSLRLENIHRQEGNVYLRFYGKRDKERIVPLTSAGRKELERYLVQEQPTDWLFPGYYGPISPHGLRKYTRKIAERYPELAGLSPHVLRHTYATMALRKGVDLKHLQMLMGHDNIQTTSRYLHPSIEDLQHAVDQLD
jgi:integrase/recombinase XerD